MDNIYDTQYIIMGNSNNYNDNDDDMYYLIELINSYVIEKNKLLDDVDQITKTNIKLSNYIDLLVRKYYYINVKHNNTINFLMSTHNLKSIKRLIKKYTDIYDNNLFQLNILQHKIYNIDVFLNKMK